ncbi:MAG: zinc-binding alcohol dehydrogenase, partial [Actinomycetota bacterium]|nr:zinc-binding alcohol dehydrogenase [Actinomycetota bacterium]
VDETAIDPWHYAKDRWRHAPGDRGADFVFQCRGRTSYLASALRTLRPQGTVIDLAFYQEGAGDVHLGDEFHHNGLSIRCAQVARVPRGASLEWDRRRLAEETLALLGTAGAQIRRHVITDVVDVDEAAVVVNDLATRQRDAIQIVFRF